ncbi:hypothetical protein [Rhizobacter sp. OV335]|uniref:hypothetical protein n=1 Tax=Rhizobacter sp. OV335 TaxID=1500264 RepID=UPI001161510B|nr:hypothetical protein [Rhizobacter sp. OV335]
MILALWAGFLFLIGYGLTFRVEHRMLRIVAGGVAVLLLFLAPIYDEILGGSEFEELCMDGSIYKISAGATDKRFDLIYAASAPSIVPGLIRPANEIAISYTDVASGAIIATGKAFIAKGGWLAGRHWAVSMSGGDGPLLGRAQCFPGDQPEEARRLHAITNRIIN